MATRLGLVRCGLALGTLALSLVSGAALAQSAAPEAAAATPGASAGTDGAQADKPFEASAGLKVLLGGSLFGTPDNIPGGYEGLGFAGSAGGFAYGGALYAEGRFFRYLGLELDIGYDDTTLKRNVTYNGTVDVTESVESSGMWFGFLVKGVVPTPFGRFWAGLGPQFMNPSSADAKLESDVAVATKISAKTESSTMLNMGLGLVIHAGELIEIPVELRAAKNLSQEADWDKRVHLTTTGNQITGYEVTAQSSWDFRLGLGVGARF